MTELYNYRYQMGKAQNRTKLLAYCIGVFCVWFFKLLRQEVSNALELNNKQITDFKDLMYSSIFQN